MADRIRIDMTVKISTGTRYASTKDLITWIKSLERDADHFKTPLEAIQYIKEGIYDISL